MSEKKQKFGRAFNACVNTDWAITQDGYRNILMIAARLNDTQAVEAYREKELENTVKVKIRHGVAVIPIIGPIFRYNNLFTYYSGGTSVAELAKDFNAALDNPEVFSIMFEMNTPGGEVTGINELGKMIFAARKKMPMTTRVGGLMCSAGLWLGVMAGDVVIDETAMVGSLGVCTAYIDDRKNLEMHGFEELEFISSQSPYKNAPPYTEEGKKRIQARLDALCNIFGEAVALGRDVPIATVWKKFGQGDVFVGQDAIDAGLADRIGSYEETLRLLAKAHTPGYVEMEEKENLIDTGSTINLLNELNSESTEAPASQTENKIEEKEIMSQENTDNQKAAADFEAREKELASREKALADREAEVSAKTEAAVKAEAEAKATVRRAEFAKQAEKFHGDIAGKISTMESLADAFGQDSAVFKAYVADQKALAAQIEAGEIFKEQGASGEGEGKTAEQEIDALAAERAKQKGISVAQAMTEIATENPELYARYEAEN